VILATSFSILWLKVKSPFSKKEQHVDSNSSAITAVATFSERRFSLARKTDLIQ
jgi:hypothetical protein